MAKVVFFFAGTGDNGSGYHDMKERGLNHSQFEDGVIRIYIKGCQEERVGNGFLFPDLEIAANNVRNAFKGKELDIKQLKQNFGDGLYKIEGNWGDEPITVDEIALEGFSRGAVTTFATAKKLDDLQIPMHIFANQPVPGDTNISKRLYSQYCDLSRCRNIKSARTFLCSYDREQGPLHNHFFRQMITKFAPDVNAQQILFPHQHHLDWFNTSPIHSHIDRFMAEQGFTKKGLNEEEQIMRWYKQNSKHYFTPHEYMQSIYGATGPIPKDPIYLQTIVNAVNECLKKANVEIQNINPEQAAAIVAIDSLSDLDTNRAISAEKKKMLFELALKATDRGGQFTKIINKVTELCDYLPHVTADNSTSNKSNLIKLHSDAYKKSVFLNSYTFLMKEKPNKEDKTTFVKGLYRSECEFRKNALGIERGLLRRIFMFLTNFITHITGVGLLLNTIHKAQTGNWLFLKHNRSENVVRDARKELLKNVDEMDANIKTKPPKT